MTTAKLEHRTSGSSLAVAARLERIAVLVLVPLALVGLVLNLGLAMLPLAGYHPTAISGGSMEPTIHAGSLVVSRSVQADSLQVGDVITYRREGAQASVTHRIVDEHVIDGQRSFTTKGDGNQDADPVDISFSSDVQRVTLTVPYAGFIYVLLRNPSVMLLMTALPAIGLALLFVLGMGKPGIRADQANT